MVNISDCYSTMAAWNHGYFIFGNLTNYLMFSFKISIFVYLINNVHKNISDSVNNDNVFYVCGDWEESWFK